MLPYNNSIKDVLENQEMCILQTFLRPELPQVYLNIKSGVLLISFVDRPYAVGV